MNCSSECGQVAGMKQHESRRRPCASDVSDKDCALVVSCLALIREDAPQPEHSLRKIFNGLRYIVCAPVRRGA